MNHEDGLKINQILKDYIKNNKNKVSKKRPRP